MPAGTAWGYDNDAQREKRFLVCDRGNRIPNGIMGIGQLAPRVAGARRNSIRSSGWPSNILEPRTVRHEVESDTQMWQLGTTFLSFCLLRAGTYDETDPLYALR